MAQLLFLIQILATSNLWLTHQIKFQLEVASLVSSNTTYCISIRGLDQIPYDLRKTSLLPLPL